MTGSARLSDLSRLRQLRLDRAAIALARANGISAERLAAADESEALRAAQENELPAVLSGHLARASILAGTNERFAAFVLSATAERQSLARQTSLARLDRTKADEALRAAEACRKAYGVQVRRREALNGIISRLEHETKHRLAPVEEDRALESYQAREAGGGGCA